jgi:hypothetical protein
MSEPVLPPASADDLQFSRVESGDSNSSVVAPGQSCAACGKPIVSTYYALEDKVLCPACCAQVNAPLVGSKLGRFVKATFLGVGAGLVGAVIWFAIRRVAHIEVGLVAILVGFMVGKAVRVGSGGRGGRGYQVLAVLITYCCIAANYMPDIVEAAFSEFREDSAVVAESADTSQAEAAGITSTNAADGETDVKSETPANVGFGEAAAALGLLFVFVFALSSWNGKHYRIVDHRFRIVGGVEVQRAGFTADHRPL